MIAAPIGHKLKIGLLRWAFHKIHNRHEWSILHSISPAIGYLPPSSVQPTQLKQLPIALNTGAVFHKKRASRHRAAVTNVHTVELTVQADELAAMHNRRQLVLQAARVTAHIAPDARPRLEPACLKQSLEKLVELKAVTAAALDHDLAKKLVQLKRHGLTQLIGVKVFKGNRELMMLYQRIQKLKIWLTRFQMTKPDTLQIHFHLLLVHAVLPSPKTQIRLCKHTRKRHRFATLRLLAPAKA